MFCKKCGSPLEEGARFCGNCGTPVDMQNIPKAQKPGSEPAGPQKIYEPGRGGGQEPLGNGNNGGGRRQQFSEEPFRTGSRKRNPGPSAVQKERAYGQGDAGKKKENLWEEDPYDEEYEREEKREKTVFIVLSVIIVILVAAIVAGVVLLIRGEGEKRQAPQLNEELRQELEKDDDDQEKTEDADGDSSEKTTPEVTGQPQENAQEDSDRQVTPNPTVQAQNTPTPTALPTPTPTPEAVKEISGEYILPYSSIQYITEADLDGLSEWEIRIARNEIYARHGRMFTSPDLAEYFAQKSWYVPTIPADQFDNSYLNSIEIANLQVITKYEADHNLNQ